MYIDRLTRSVSDDRLVEVPCSTEAYTEDDSGHAFRQCLQIQLRLRRTSIEGSWGSPPHRRLEGAGGAKKWILQIVLDCDSSIKA